MSTVSRSESPSQHRTDRELPSLSDILDFTSDESSKWCSKLGLASRLLKKDNQIALIDYVNAACFKLPFDQRPTSFTWAFTKEELRQCDAARKLKSLASKEFTDRNGIVWRLLFYPKGGPSSSPQKTGVYLVAMNLAQTGVVKVQLNFAISHVESEVSANGGVALNAHTSARGFFNFMDMPSVAPSQCPICLEDVSEKLATECGHAFCAKCIVKMLTDSAQIKCPLCRRTVARSDELVAVRYSALESFTLKATVTTVLLEKDMGVAATLGDVMCMSQTLERKFDDKLSEISEKLSSQMSRMNRMSEQMSQMSERISQQIGSLILPVSASKALEI